jgi:hypothetical protein
MTDREKKLEVIDKMRACARMMRDIGKEMAWHDGGIFVGHTIINDSLLLDLKADQAQQSLEKEKKT